MIRRIGLGPSSVPFRDVVAGASAQTWTFDPFDGILVGEACVTDASLVTKDESIGEHYPRAVW